MIKTINKLSNGVNRHPPKFRGDIFWDNLYVEMG